MDHQDAATSLDHQDAATSLDHQDAATSLDHQDAATSLDHQDAATSLDHQSDAATLDHQGDAVTVDQDDTAIQEEGDAGTQTLSLEQLQQSLTLGPSWSTHHSSCGLQVYKLSSVPSCSSQPPAISHSVTVKQDLSWKVFVYGHMLTTTSNTPLDGQCHSCKIYRPQLRAMYSRWAKKSEEVPKCSNDRYLNTPQKKKKMKTLQSRVHTAEKEVQKLQDKIKRLTEQSGIGLEESFSADLCSIMEENNSDVTRNFAEGSFSRLFWCQQLQAAKVTNSKQMRWHPCMIRWCLNLKSLSSSA